jgi:hypothetical protein
MLPLDLMTITSFSIIQLASESGNAPALVFFSVQSSRSRQRRFPHAAAD